jgi:hypothetical protein
VTFVQALMGGPFAIDHGEHVGIYRDGLRGGPIGYINGSNTILRRGPYDPS